jgi:hypothetical protein
MKPSLNTTTTLPAVQAIAPTPSAVPRVSLTPDDAAIAAGVSRTRIFQAIRDGKLAARGDGKATIIEVEELVRYVRSLPLKRNHAP